MQVLRRAAVAALAGAAWLQPSLAQLGEDTVSQYTNPDTNITFNRWAIEEIVEEEGYGQGFYDFGMILPPDALEKDANEYIGYLRCQSVHKETTGGGWCGISHGLSGQMTNSLLLIAWPEGDQVHTSLRSVTAWMLPPVYTGNATVTQIWSSVNETQYEVIFRCQNCFTWQGGEEVETKVSTKAGQIVLGRAQGVDAPQAPKCPSKLLFGFHDHGYGQYGANLENATHTSYSAWAARATQSPTTDCVNIPEYTTKPTPTPTGPIEEAPPEETFEPGFEEPQLPRNPPNKTCAPVPSTKTYDYIIVGAGAAGIPLADRLTAAGRTVLVLEKGPPSSGKWGGTIKTDWLRNSTNNSLSIFDVPGLAQAWLNKNATSVHCDDTVQPLGCLLGGGAEIGPAVWFKPHPLDWESFPTGWKANDMAAATNRAFQRIPAATITSKDGILYQEEGFNVVASGLNASGFKFIVPNDQPDQRNHVYGRGQFMVSNGERSGPLGTYLASASQRSQLTVWMNSPVRRLVRKGGHITGVELECNNGYEGIVSVTPGTGRVILSAGTFGSAKILLRSGIGPADQLEIVAGSEVDGPTFAPKETWIDLPVGYNLGDAVSTEVEIMHTNNTNYNWANVYNKANQTDVQKYLNNRTGPLAQMAPNIGLVWWDDVRGPDGQFRNVMWVARGEGSTGNSITLTQVLGRGSFSKGRLTISARLNTLASVPPYLRNDLDREVVIAAFESVQKMLNHVDEISWTMPPPYLTPRQFVETLERTAAVRRTGHWIGTCKIGSDDGRRSGSAVVDPNNKVYGTDNLFVVDASIIPSITTNHPLGVVISIAERAFDRINALRQPTANRQGSQCGGNAWTGSFACPAGLECVRESESVSRCVQAPAAPSSAAGVTAAPATATTGAGTTTDAPGIAIPTNAVGTPSLIAATESAAPTTASVVLPAITARR